MYVGGAVQKMAAISEQDKKDSQSRSFDTASALSTESYERSRVEEAKRNQQIARQRRFERRGRHGVGSDYHDLLGAVAETGAACLGRDFKFIAQETSEDVLRLCLLAFGAHSSTGCPTSRTDICLVEVPALTKFRGFKFKGFAKMSKVPLDVRHLLYLAHRAPAARLTKVPVVLMIGQLRDSVLRSSKNLATPGKASASKDVDDGEVAITRHTRIQMGPTTFASAHLVPALTSELPAHSVAIFVEPPTAKAPSKSTGGFSLTFRVDYLKVVCGTAM